MVFFTIQKELCVEVQRECWFSVSLQQFLHAFQFCCCCLLLSFEVFLLKFKLLIHQLQFFNCRIRFPISTNQRACLISYVLSFVAAGHNIVPSCPDRLNGWVYSCPHAWLTNISLWTELHLGAEPDGVHGFCDIGTASAEEEFFYPAPEWPCCGCGVCHSPAGQYWFRMGQVGTFSGRTGVDTRMWNEAHVYPRRQCVSGYLSF